MVTANNLFFIFIFCASLVVNNLRELTFSAREPKGKDGLVQLVAFAIGPVEPIAFLLPNHQILLEGKTAHDSAMELPTFMF